MAQEYRATWAYCASGIMRNRPSFANDMHTYVHTYVHTYTYIHTYIHTRIHTYRPSDVGLRIPCTHRWTLTSCAEKFMKTRLMKVSFPQGATWAKESELLREVLADARTRTHARTHAHTHTHTERERERERERARQTGRQRDSVALVRAHAHARAQTRTHAPSISSINTDH